MNTCIVKPGQREASAMTALPRLAHHTDTTSYAPARVEMGEEA
ncbi:hypothetical protein HDA43_002739 [Streptosporangium sandarakinum]|uniref:Uncharacterized protein n=1 Tax=Streptosporangium sandarakinum TaxID=1260955 RepID=A0A852UXB1_9ACTN|nr:hypothetical protein [Streptosporangium sandarakinum]